MQFFDSPGEARTAITMYLMTHASTLPEDIRTRLIELGSSPSPVDQIVRTGEFLYARQSDVGEEGRNLAAALASYASLNGWHGMADDDRGGKIAQAMRRENGETPSDGREFPEASADPAAKPEFLPPVPEEEVPVPEEKEPAPNPE